MGNQNSNSNAHGGGTEQPQKAAANSSLPTAATANGQQQQQQQQHNTTNKESTTHTSTDHSQQTSTSVNTSSASSICSPSGSSASLSFPVGDKFYGLENFGNTCYANSVLQALYACLPFRQHILLYYEENKKKKVENETLLMCLAHLFYRIQTSKKSRGVLAPSTLVKKLKRSNDQFDSALHQDAQEFLIFLLNDISDTIKAEKQQQQQTQMHIQQHEQELTQAAQHKKPKTPSSSSSSLLDLSSDIPFVLPNLSAISAATAAGTISPVQTPKHAQQRKKQLQNNTTEPQTDNSNIQQQQEAISHKEGDANHVGSTSVPVLVTSKSESIASPSGAGSRSGTSTASSPSSPPSSSPSPSASPTWVQSLFEGTLTNITECIRCGNITYRDESFLDLSVDIEDNSSITACLRSFSNQEMLNGSDKYLCDSCGCRQEAFKSLQLKMVPPIVILHIKRFKYSEQIQAYAKLCYRVGFPLDIRLTNWMQQTTTESNTPTVQQQNSSASTTGGTTSTNKQPVAQNDRLYQLTAVVVHIGNGARSGHYVCLCRGSSNQFYCYDDTTITAIPEADIQATFGTVLGGSHQDGYLLFYSQEPQTTTNTHSDLHTHKKMQSRSKVTANMQTHINHHANATNTDDVPKTETQTETLTLTDKREKDEEKAHPRVAEQTDPAVLPATSSKG